jgi:hypothetical protein
MAGGEKGWGVGDGGGVVGEGLAGEEGILVGIEVAVAVG